MSCSKIRQHLEAAEEEVRQALAASIDNKHEENLTLLVDTLNNIKELLVTTPIRGVDNLTEHYRNYAEHNFTVPDADGGVNTVDGYKFSLESDIDLNTGGYKVPADILQFPTTIPGADLKIDSGSGDVTFTGGDFSACNNASWDYNLGGVSVGDIDLSGNLDFTTNDIQYTDNVVNLGDKRVGKDLDKLDDIGDKNKQDGE
tara:strand:+ start:1306 stop:1908 length:603 start_codon:yes stop_codon:yes gene_type:complete